MLITKMEKIIAIYCSYKHRVSRKEYPDYRDKFYDLYKFARLNVFDGIKTTTYTVDELKNIGFIFNKNVTLIAFDAYFHFNLLFHHLNKQGLDVEFDLGNCGATCCVTDLCTLTNYPIPRKTLPNAIAYFKQLMKKEVVQNNIVLREMSAYWITHGGERIVNESSGKWMIFGGKRLLQKLWELIIKNHDELQYDQARVSTMAVSIWGGKQETGVIELFYSKKNNVELMEVGIIIKTRFISTLKELKVSRIYYKTDMQSKQGNRLNGVRHNSSFHINI
jgi:hypothetical protein